MNVNMVERLLRIDTADDIGLPPVLITSIAMGSQDVYLLLMWLVKRILAHPGLGDDAHLDAIVKEFRKASARASYRIALVWGR